MRNTQVISNTLIALVLSRMATHAVVGEGTRTILQSRFVSQIDFHFIQRITTTSAKSKGWHCSNYECSK